MKGDFSRLTFDPAKQYSRVLIQQGRVQLDADWNEQADIFQHALRTLAADLIGPFGAPANPDGTAGTGFMLARRRAANGTLIPGDFSILPGRYYVDGIACENPQEWNYNDNIGHPPPGKLEANQRYFLYLDVWERHVIYLQDESLREVALGGPDTATRSKVTWRVRAVNETPDGGPIPSELACLSVRGDWSRWVEQWQSTKRGRLKARARPGKTEDTDPCLAAPEARYRGENQLYRVEIHTGIAEGEGRAEFKWSSDNGSVVYPIRELATDPKSDTTTATLEHLGRDDRGGLVQGDWVEIVDGEEDLRLPNASLLKVSSVDSDRRRVTLSGSPAPDLGKDPSKPLMLRRWDHRRGSATKELSSAGTYPVLEGEWIDLEDGVQIFFEPSDDQEGALQDYRAGDYWLIPARVATGDVEWPGPPEAPLFLPPHGVEHHYAPLGFVTLHGDQIDITDCRTTFGVRSLRLNTGLANWQVTAEPISGTDTVAVNMATAPTESAKSSRRKSAAAQPGVIIFDPGSGSGRPIPRPVDLVLSLTPGWGTLPGASWVSASPTGSLPEGLYKYELSFDLCSCLHDVAISLDVLADNRAEVFLNDHSLGRQTGDKGFVPPPMHVERADPSLLVAGTNVLRVEVNNEGGPTGFILRGTVNAGGVGF